MSGTMPPWSSSACQATTDERSQPSYPLGVGTWSSSTQVVLIRLGAAPARAPPKASIKPISAATTGGRSFIYTPMNSRWPKFGSRSVLKIFSAEALMSYSTRRNSNTRLSVS